METPIESTMESCDPATSSAVRGSKIMDSFTRILITQKSISLRDSVTEKYH